MFLANPWGLLGLAAVPAIVAIHYLRRRFRPLRVAGLFLWADEVRRRPPGRRWDRLPFSASLLLELLAAGLLAVLLADPRIGGKHSVRHLVVVLDNSASMSAGRGPGRSVRDQAIERVIERVEPLGPGGRITVLATGQAPRPLLGPAAPVGSPAQVRAALEAWQPALPDHSPDPALALGRQLVGDEGQVLFLTDRLPAPADAVEGVDYVALGTPLANVGFVAARRDAEPGGGRCFIRLGNFSGSPAAVELVGRTLGEGPAELTRQNVELPARSERGLTIDLPPGTGAVEFRIGGTRFVGSARLPGHDEAWPSLAADDRVILATASPKPVRYRNDLPAGPLRDAVDKAMGSIRGTVRVDLAPGSADAEEPAHLLFASAGSPPPSSAAPALAETWRLLFGPLPAPHPAAAPPDTQPDELTTDGPFTIDRGAGAAGLGPMGLATPDLVRDVTLDGVILGRIAPTAGLKLSPIVSAGDLVVLGRVSDAAEPTWLFNADLAPTRSSLVRSVDWVILLSNLVAARREAMPGLGERNFRLGEPVTIPLAPPPPGLEGHASSWPHPHGPDEAGPSMELILPDGARRPVPRRVGSVVILDDLSISGQYALQSAGDGGRRTVESFAVNLLDERESDLTSASSGRLGERAEPTGLMLVTEQTTLGWLTALLASLAAAAILANWWLLGRRGAS